MSGQTSLVGEADVAILALEIPFEMNSVVMFQTLPLLKTFWAVFTLKSFFVGMDFYVRF